MAITTFDMSDFSDADSMVRNLCEDTALEVAQKLTLDVHARLVAASPVDTGYFRGNWTVVTPTKGFASGIIENNTSYGPYLLDGHSKEAPAGWFDNAIMASVVFGGK